MPLDDSDLSLLVELGADGVGDGLHLIGGELELGVGEEHVLLALHGDEVDVGVGHFEAEDGLADLDAGDDGLDGTRHMGGEDVQAAELFVGEVEDVIDFTTGDDEGMTLHQGVDVEEGIELLVAGAAVAGYLASGNFTEDGHLSI